MVQKKYQKRKPKKYSKKSRGPTTKVLDKKIRNIENNLIELKYNDVYVTGALITPAGIFGDAVTHSIQRGTGPEQRVGDEIECTSARIRMQIAFDSTNLQPVIWRFMAVWDRQPNGLSIATFLTGGPQAILDTTLITAAWLAPVSYQSNKRFKVLRDKTFVHNPSGTSVASITNNLAATATQTTSSFEPHYIHKDMYIKLSRKTKYSGNTGTIADVVTNCLNFIWISSAAATQPSLAYGVRMYYRDS